MCGGFLGDVFRIGTAVVAVAVAAVTLNPFAIVAAVGAVASVVGHYTGSKELKIAGGVLGAIGAIGGLANASGMFELGDIGLDPASTGLSWGSEAAAGAGSFGASGAGELGLPGAGNGAPFGAVTVETMPDAVSLAGGVTVPEVGIEAAGNPFNPLSNVAANAIGPDVLPEAAVNSGLSEGVTPSVGMINQPVTASGGDSAQLASFGDANVPSVNVAAPAAPNDPAAGVTGASAPTPASGVPSTESLVNSPVTGTNPGIGIERGATSTPASESASLGSGAPTVWSKMWDFVKTPGGSMMAFGAMQAGSAFLAGATSSLTPAQVKALEAQAAANRAAANLSQQQLQNMQGTLPTAYRRAPTAPAATAVTGQTTDQPADQKNPPVTGQPAPPPGRGLINSPPPRPPQLAPVTGAPA